MTQEELKAALAEATGLPPDLAIAAIQETARKQQAAKLKADLDALSKAWDARANAGRSIIAGLSSRIDAGDLTVVVPTIDQLEAQAKA